MYNIVDNKHYTINVWNIFVTAEGKLQFEWDYRLNSTRATKFQARKLVARKLIGALRNAVYGDARRRTIGTPVLC